MNKIEKDKQLIIFGLHSVRALLLNKPKRVIKMFIQKGRDDKKINDLLDLAEAKKILVQTIIRTELDHLTKEANHQGVVLICRKQKAYKESDLKTILDETNAPPLILVLDQIKDPQNLGACFRSADAAGVDVIITPKDHSASITPAVVKVASGAVDCIPFIQVTNLSRTLKGLKEEGVWIYGADQHAEKTIYHTNLTSPVAIVLGSEEKGLRRLTKEHCDMLVSIPMYGSVASLNVSVAAGIFLFEVVRQRQLMTLY